MLHRLLNSIKKEEAFTLEQTLLGLVVLLVVSASIWTLGGLVINNIDRMSNTLLIKNKAEKIDRSLRNCTAMIFIPYWSSIRSISIDTDSLMIPWVQGKSDHFLEITHEDNNTLTIKYPDNMSLFKHIDDFNIAPLYSKDNLLAGLEYTYSLQDNTYTTKALFGSWSLVGKTE